MKALRMLLFMVALTGFFYPLGITAIAQFFMSEKANGEVVQGKNGICGYVSIGQKFEDDTYFWGRPSAIEWNPLSSGGSNLGPTSKQLQEKVREQREKIASLHKVAPHEVPSELLFASGSGLDPHISVQAALFQVPRVAKIRKIEENTLQELVHKMTIHPRFHIFGKPVVNVLLLNKALVIE